MSLRWVAAALLTFALAIPGVSQTRRLTTDDYSRAEKFLGYNTNPLMLHAPARPVWLADDRFWYRVPTERGTEFILEDPVRGTRGPAFDQAKVAAALSSASGTPYEAFHLPFAQFTFEEAGGMMGFDIGARRWTCDVQGARC